MELKALIAQLFDENSFCDIGLNDLTAGFGTVGARPVCCALAEDIALPDATESLRELINFALKTGAPAVLCVNGLAEAAALYPAVSAMARAGGAIPLVWLSLGNQAQAPYDIAALCDARITVKSADTPAVACDLTAPDAESAIEKLRTLLFYLPSNCFEDAPLLDTQEDAARATILRADARPLSVPDEIADTDCVLDMGSAQALRLFLMRIGGRSVGAIVSDNGTASEDAARFVRLCDAYSLPLVYIATQSEGFRGARFLSAWAAATTAKIGLFTHSAPLRDERFDLCFSLGGGGVRVAPDACRARLIAALDLLSAKRDTLPPRKHGSTP